MITWVEHREQMRVMRASLLLQLTDAFTGLPPDDDSLTVALERLDPFGHWGAVDAQPIFAPGGVVAYRNLERRARAVGLPPVLYRFALASKRYLPSYRKSADFVTVSIAPFDLRTVPPPVDPPSVAVTLYPRPNYAFRPVPLVQGRVLDAATQAPVSDASVFALTAATLSDEHGRFVLPQAGAQFGVPIVVGAVDRLNRQDAQNVSFTSNVSTQSLTLSLT